MVIENARQKEILCKVGLDPDKDYSTDDELIELGDLVSGYLQKHGFGKSPKYEITEIGKICEDILDRLATIE